MRRVRRQHSSPGCLLAAAATDVDAFGEFYEAYAQQLLVFLVRRVIDVDVALDLMSESFAIALNKRCQFRGTTAAEEQSWLYSIANSQMLRYWRDGAVERRALRRLGLQPATLDGDEYARITDLAGVEALKPELLAALDALPPDQQEAVRMRVVEELDYREVATHLGVSEQVVRARVSRGLRTLAGVLTEPRTAKDAA